MNRTKNNRSITRLPLGRLNGLTDGVLGFAMTLLVLNVDIPEGHDFSKDKLVDFFARLEHDMVIYAASFFLIARYWIEHHLIFHCIRYVSRTLIWLNVLLMFSVTMVPFATKLKGQYEREADVAALFGAVHLACWLALLGIWRYAVSRPALLQMSFDPKVEPAINRRLLVGPVVILAAIGLSYVNIRLGNFAFLLLPLFYLLQPRVDLHLDGDAQQEDT